MAFRWRVIDSRASFLGLGFLIWIGAGGLWAQISPLPISLAASTSPATAQPAVTVVTLTCSGLPSGTITAASLNVTLQPGQGAKGPALTTQVSGFAALPVSGGRISFKVNGPNVSAPTPYLVSVSGSTATGTSFASSKPASLTINPPAQIVSIAPSAAQPGQTLQVMITGQYTNYVQGSTTAIFGPGVSVASLTVTSPTTATAQLTVAVAAATGIRSVTVATGVQSATADLFSIVSSSTLLSINPSTGTQGQSAITVTITGQFTSFVQGTSTVSFGAGITVASLTVNSPTSATAVLNIDPAAATGARNVTVTTGGEVVTLNNGFAVTAGSPVITQVCPNGSSFAYVSGQVSNDISVYNINPSTGALAAIGTFPTPSAQSFAVAPCRNLLFVTTYAQQGSVSAFSINPTTGGLTAVAGSPSPTGSFPYRVTIAASGRFIYTANYGSNNISVFSVDLNSGMLTPVAGSPYAVGANPYDVGVSPSGQFVYVANAGSNTISAFTSDPDTGALAPIPGSPFAVTGQSQDIFTGAGAGPAFIAVSPSGQFAYVANQHSDTVSVYSIDPSTGALTAIPSSPFSTAPSPLFLAFAPSAAFIYVAQGGTPLDRLDGAVSAYGVNNTTGALTQVAGSPFPSGSATWAAAIDASGSFAYAPNSYSNTVSAFRISPSTGALTPLPGSPFPTGSYPVEVAVAGLGGRQGQTNLPVTITGQFTHFVQGLTQVSFGADITVNNVTVSSATSVIANVTIPSTATLGGRTATVTTGGEVVSLANSFIVQPGVAGISHVSPSTGQQGQQNLPVTITGQATHFNQGTTTVSFGAGVDAGTITVTDATHLTVPLTIDPSAALGGRTVTIATGAEVVSLINGFTVAAGTPVLLTVNPNTGQQGQQNLSVTITAQFTHWVQSTTTASFGAGITVVSLTINSPISATAVLNIDPDAATGARNVTVTTGAEAVVLPNGFDVQANHPPVITSLPPRGPVWENLPSLGGPPRGRDVGINPNVYDEVNDRLIFFSGDWLPEPPIADVWVLANASGRNGTPTWIQLALTSPGPAGRIESSLTYVKESNRLIVCGGNTGLGDCWVLTNANGLGGDPSWIRLPDMPNVIFGSAAYDSATRRLMMYGFVNATTNQFLILSDADGIGTPTWSTPTVSGTAPLSRYTQSVAYDPSTNRLIVFGGLYRPTGLSLTYLNDLWILTNANGVGGTPQWVQLFPTGGPPAARGAHSFSYDPQKNEAVLFGGAAATVFDQAGRDVRNDAFADLWQLNNANGAGTPQWVQLNPVGRKPIGHFYSAMGRDTANQVLPMALGRFEESTTYNSALLFTDTWRLNLAEVGAAVGTAFTYDVDATDPDGDIPSFSLTQSPDGMSISSTTGLISFVPKASQIGRQSVTVSVDDGRGLSATQSFEILVVPAVAETPPSVVSVVPDAAQPGTIVDVTVTGQDSNFVPGQTSVYFYNGTATGPYSESVTVLDAATAVVRFNIPANTQLGSWSFNIGTGFELGL